MTIVKDLFGNDHTIQPCRAEDVDVHFNKIRNVIPHEEVIQFKKRMSECINVGSAYTLSDGSCYLYYFNDQPWHAYGVALYGKNSPLKMLALFAGIFRELDRETFKIDFVLHKGKFADEYRSILTETSIKRHRITGHPLVIRVDEIRDRVNAIYKKRGIPCQM